MMPNDVIVYWMAWRRSRLFIFFLGGEREAEEDLGPALKNFYSEN